VSWAVRYPWREKAADVKSPGLRCTAPSIEQSGR